MPIKINEEQQRSVTTIADDALPSEVIIVCSGESCAKQYAVEHGMLYYCEE